jgi:hypothetical protein
MGTFVRRSTSRAALAAFAAAVASLSLGAAAQAAPPSLPPQAKDHGDFFTLSGKANDKAATIERLERALETASPGVARQSRTHGHASIHGSAHLTGYRSKAVMCSSAYAKFDDTISHPFLETSATVSGSSRTAWLGNCPFNANTVTLRDEICFDSIGFSVSIGGGGFSGSGGGCGDWSASVGSAWYINHSYSGVKGSGSLINPIWRVRQSSAGTFKFGTNFYTVVASGSLVICGADEHAGGAHAHARPPARAPSARAPGAARRAGVPDAHRVRHAPPCRA